MQARRRRQISLPVAGQVTSLELFFDLVFVFTITQLTTAVLPGGWAVTGRTALLLLLLWWMYGGYAWLTNAAPPVTPRRRMLLVVGMVGLFVTDLAIPHAFALGESVLAIGIGLGTGVDSIGLDRVRGRRCVLGWGDCSGSPSV
jgi:low temperature requirement protein LtrA